MSGCRLPWVSLLTDLMNEWSWFFLLFSGRNTMKATGLMLMPEGFCTDYNPAVNPAILNEFASAAFRWHTLVQVQLLCNCFSWNLSFVKLFFFQGFYQLMSENGQVRENYQMRKIFNNPSLLYRDGAIDEATYGLVAAKSEAFDPIFIDDVWCQTMSSFFTTGFSCLADQKLPLSCRAERHLWHGPGLHQHSTRPWSRNAAVQCRTTSLWTPSSAGLSPVE